MTGPRRPNALTGMYPPALYCRACGCHGGAHLANCTELPAEVRADARGAAGPGFEAVVAPKGTR